VCYLGNIHTGIVVYFGVFALALICGPIRGVPFYWQLIDCSFGLFALYPVWRIVKLSRELQA
jgi:hypothetical protein